MKSLYILPELVLDSLRKVWLYFDRGQWAQRNVWKYSRH